MSEEKKIETTPETPAVETKPTLAAGLFKPFTLGSTLTPGEIGNNISNLKQAPMDYTARAEASKNQSMTAEELSKLEVKKSKFKEVSDAIQRKEGYSKDRADAITAEAGRKELGEAEMERRAKEGKVKKSMETEEDFTAIPEALRSQILAELDRRAEVAKAANDSETLSTIEKAKEKAKKCWGPQMDQKQPKTE